MLTISPKVNRTTFSGYGYENFNQSLNNYHAKGSLTNIAVQSNEQITRSPKKSFSLIEKLNPINLLTKKGMFSKDENLDSAISLGLFFGLISIPLIILHGLIEGKTPNKNPNYSHKRNLLFTAIAAPIIGLTAGSVIYQNGKYIDAHYINKKV